MRNTNLFFVLLATFIILTGCSSDDDSSNSFNESKLIGIWHSVPNAIDDLTIEFTSNHRAYFTYHEFNDLTDGGDWQLTDNRLKIYWDDADEGNEIYNLEILELTDSTLKWRVNIDGDDYVETYTR